ncbi:MAG TPA: nucleotidyltransferase family protein [Rubrivivax sp.]|nr:nucleotidyltransferase family protein [Rubrivivax sp.]
MTALKIDAKAGLAWLQALREPLVAAQWEVPEWEQVIRLSRRLRLLGRLAAGLAGAGMLDGVPAPARRHLIAELRLSQWRTSAMSWAIDRIAVALDGRSYPLVLLKGAAYVGQDLSISAGRLPSDLDVMVPRACLADVQARLLEAGWQELELDDHDRRYYHEWSHEVPPMRHPIHRIELDLHHNILPPIARTRVDAQRLIARVQPSKWPQWQVLHPTDQVLHSAAHLFFDSELRDRVRDLVDLDALMRHFGGQPVFWEELPQRARELGLAEPLALACHFCTRWLGTPIPDGALAGIESAGPSRLRRAWLLPLLGAVLQPAEPDGEPPLWQGPAATLLLARHHRQRMPLRLLLPHLWHKLRPDRASTRQNAEDAAPV